METTRAANRFFESTRGQVISLLRRRPRTVDEIAGELGLTDNAIRTHLATLERDGLVMQGEPRRGVGKPAFTYTLTNEADGLFPKPYGAMLQQLLQVLGERLPRQDLSDALSEVGHRIARTHTSLHLAVTSGAPLSSRVVSAVDTLGSLGGLAEAEETDDGYLIRGFSCPLANAVEGNPDACLVAETLLSDLLGVPVQQVCDQGPPPRCRFAVHREVIPPGGRASLEEKRPMQ